MDVNTIRIAITLAALGAYIAIVLWAYTPGRKPQLDEEARRILNEIDG